MNFYNPYFYSMPLEKTGILSKLSFSSILSGANKTLNVVNQSIPLVKQMSPLMKNMKTMFNIMNEFKKANTGSTKENNETIKSKSIGPTFFI